MNTRGTGNVYVVTLDSMLSCHFPNLMERKKPQERALRLVHERHTFIDGKWSTCS